MAEKINGYINGYLIGAVLAVGGFTTGISITTFTDNIIPRAKQVQSGFAVPNKLEILLQDLDNNGEKETLLKYDGKTYLLLYDGNMPKIVPYEVKPAEIVKKE